MNARSCLLAGLVLSIGCSSGAGNVADDLASGAADLATPGGSDDLATAGSDLAGGGSDLGAATATTLQFTVQPRTGPTGARILPAIRVTLVDASGQPVTGATESVTLAFAANPGNATLGGTLTVAANSGVAIFGDLTVGAPGFGYQLSATATNLTAATSDPFDVGVAFQEKDGLGHLASGVMDFQRVNTDDGPWNDAFAAFDTALDPVSHQLYIADPENSRVLVFALSASNDLAGQSHAAAFVLGEPDFRTSGSGVPTASNFAFPSVLAIDPAGHRLFVGDRCRVLVFDTSALANNAAATRVLGQPNLNLNVMPSAPTQSAVCANGLAYDGVNQRLFVGDGGSFSRVLVFDVATITNGMNASHVLGQPNFTSRAQAVTQSGMVFPTKVAYDPVGSRLFVSDVNANRVTVFDATPANLKDGMNASFVLGQSLFTTQAPGSGTAGFGAPGALAFDATANRLFVGDQSNSRLMVFATGTITNGMNAAHVLGQASFSTPPGIVSQSVTAAPRSASVDGAGGRLFAADTGGRVLEWNLATLTDGMAAVDGLGHLAHGTMDFGATVENDHPTPGVLNAPAGVELDAPNHRLFVADGSNHRVLIFPLSASNDLTGTARAATLVLGQPDLLTTRSGTSAATMNLPVDVRLDAAHHRLFVLEQNNNRVLVFDTTSLATGMNASHVLGQINFTSSGSATTATGLNSPTGLAYDAAADRLFVVDHGNNRVLLYPTAAIADGMSATHVLGQGGFTTKALGQTQATLDAPFAAAVDGAGGRLFVSDEFNGRVLVFATGNITDGMNAANVLGAPNFTTGGGTTDARSLCDALGMAFDAGRNRLYVGDACNGMVMDWDTSTITDGMAAFTIYGQRNFTNGVAAPLNATGVQNPVGLAVDGANGRLFVSDQDLNRVVLFDAP